MKKHMQLMVIGFILLLFPGLIIMTSLAEENQASPDTSVVEALENPEENQPKEATELDEPATPAPSSDDSSAAGEGTDATAPPAETPPSFPPVSYQKYDEDSLVGGHELLWGRYQAPIMQAYRQNSPEYLAIALQSQLASNQSQVYWQKMQAAEEQMNLQVQLIETTRKQWQEFVDNGNLLGQLNCEVNLNNYTAQFNQQKASYGALGLERDLASFRGDATHLLQDTQERMAEYGFYQRYSALSMQYSQQEYLQCKLEELEYERNMEQKKLERGYSTEAALLQLEASVENCRAELSAAQSNIRITEQFITLHCGDLFGDMTPFSINHERDSDAYLGSFLNSNLNSLELETQIKAYQRYIRYAENHLEDEPSTQRLQLQLLELQAEKSKNIDLTLYVTSEYEQRNQMLNRLDAGDAAMHATMAQIVATELLESKGFTTPLESLRLKSQYAKQQYDQENTRYQLGISSYKLEFGIESTE